MAIGPYQMPPPGRVKIRLEELARERGLLVPPKHRGSGNVNVLKISQGTDLAYTTVMDLVRNPLSVRGVGLDTLARLCAFLGCQPGDLLEYVPNDGSARPGYAPVNTTQGAITQW